MSQFTLRKDGEPCLLGQLEPGKLFMFGKTVAVKSEYRTEPGEPECIIIGSGEMFWGGEFRGLDDIVVQPMKMSGWGVDDE